MLSQMDPRDFDERMAHHILEPWGDDWRRSGTIASMIWNAALLIAGRLPGEVPGPMTANDCIPYKTIGSDKPEAPLPDPETMAAQMQERFPGVR